DVFGPSVHRPPLRYHDTDSGDDRTPAPPPPTPVDPTHRPLRRTGRVPLRASSTSTPESNGAIVAWYFLILIIGCILCLLLQIQNYLDSILGAHVLLLTTLDRVVAATPTYQALVNARQGYHGARQDFHGTRQGFHGAGEYTESEAAAIQAVQQLIANRGGAGHGRRTGKA
ncbi:hypothetical protein C8R43DRAFT_941567, partial [Mycena crocata]